MKAAEPVLRCHDTTPHPFTDNTRLRCARYLWHQGPHIEQITDEHDRTGLFMWARHIRGEPVDGFVIAQPDQPTGVYAAFVPGKELT